MSQKDYEARILLALHAYQNNPKLGLNALQRPIRLVMVHYGAGTRASSLGAILSQSHADYLI
jgi:hypothetical protein